MGMIKRQVVEIHSERKTKYNDIVLYELNMTVNDYGNEHVVDVILLEEDYNMIKQEGYYLC